MCKGKTKCTACQVGSIGSIMKTRKSRKGMLGTVIAMGAGAAAGTFGVDRLADMVDAEQKFDRKLVHAGGAAAAFLGARMVRKNQHIQTGALTAAAVLGLRAVAGFAGIAGLDGSLGYQTYDPSLDLHRVAGYEASRQVPGSV